jgi:hypothetical protein
MYVAIGNHEANAHWFYDYMSYPPPEDYYSFDYGNAHFIMLDSPKGFALGSEQYAWLEKDLAATKATWKIVCHHYAPYSSDNDDYGDTRSGPGTYGDEEVRKIVPLLEQYGVDMVFFGHIHDYERTWPLREGKVSDRGIVYIQTGGGAGGLEDYAPTHTWFTAKVHRDHHYCYVTVNGNALRLTATDIDGRMFDYLDLRK